MTHCDELLRSVVRQFEASCVVAKHADGCRISLPLQTSGGHMVEVWVQQVSSNQFLLSDMGRTLSELLSYGVDVGVSPSKAERLASLQSEFGLTRSESELQLAVDGGSLPDTLLQFGHAMKTIGDMALLHRVAPVAEYRINLAVRSVLEEVGASYGEGREARVAGEVEREHQLDFVGLLEQRPFGIAVVAGRNIRQVAEAWAFRFYDMRPKNPALRRIAVYDDEQARWSKANVRILSAMTEATVPGSSLGELVTALRAA